MIRFFFFSEAIHTSKPKQQTINDESNDDDKTQSDDLEQFGSGSGNDVSLSEPQPSTSQFISNEDAFVERIAKLVTEKIEPRLTNSTWKNFNLSSPNTAIIKDTNLEGPIHYNNTIL